MPTVILLMIDGTRPDAIAAAGCPNLTALQQRSAYTLQASSVMPSITLPCHMSIFHSVPPTRHGITSNTYIPMARPLPGLIEVAAQAGKRCAFFFNWEQLRDLSRPGHLHCSRCIHDGATNPDSDHATVDAYLEYQAEHAPDFAFVYLGTVDEAGHRFGWMNEGYLQQLAHVDVAVGRLLDGLPEGSTVLFQSDHGGHDRSHGTEMPEDMNIPWMVSGPGIRENYAIQSPVSLLDTTPTLARIMDLAPHFQWEGSAPQEIFHA
ncbi:MAG: alkaline phosphatase family protein [Caldilineaceae bacterium]|nr:alkaline phosphatase family protein [Caldilineaceae bacterium]